MKKSVKIFIILGLVALVFGAGAISYAAWTASGPSSVELEGQTGSISGVGVTIDSTGLGEDGVLYPFSQPGVNAPNACMLSVTFTSDRPTVVDHYTVSNAPTSNAITLYYYKGNGTPVPGTWNANDWTVITSGGVTVQSGTVVASRATNTLYIAFETDNLMDMQKNYKLTVTAVEQTPAP